MQKVTNFVQECVQKAEETEPAALEAMFTDVYAEQPWHLREQEAQCVGGPRAKDEGDES